MRAEPGGTAARPASTAASPGPSSQPGASQWPVAKLRGRPSEPSGPSSDDDLTLPADGLAPASAEPSTPRRFARERPAEPSAPTIPRAPSLPAIDAPQESAPRGLDRAEERIKTLTTRCVDLRSRLDEAQALVRRRDEDLARLGAQHESLRSLIALRADRIRELETLLAEREGALASQSRALTEREQTLEERDRALASRRAEAVDLTERLRTAEAELERLKSQPAVPPADDLRAIRGIGEKLEARLHEQGILRYSQIASWTEEDVARIAAALSVHQKRIARDDWVGSAKAILDARGETIPEAEPTAPAASTPPPEGVDDTW
jgi:predicted flap endonuclease-1-like 5' DNA nuclease